jgi:ATP-dependent helicase/nuclease subunit B
MVNCVTIPFGLEGWRERVKLVERIISSRSRAPFLYDDILILVPSRRMQRMYGRLFLDAIQRLHGVTALAPPAVRTLHHFFEDQYKRLHGPRVMDESSRLILLEGIVKERLLADNLFNQDPGLLAPSLSAELANMIQLLSAAGATPENLVAKIKSDDFFHKPQVRLLVDVYLQYQNVLRSKSMADPAGMHIILLNKFDPSWVDGYREVIIDGIRDAGQVERDILREVTEAADSTYFIETPSMELFSGSGDFHPLFDTKAFTAALGGSTIRQEAAATEDDLFVAAALFTDRSFQEIADYAPSPSAFNKEISLLSAVNTREEISLIAGKVKKSLRNGTPADTILVAFPSLDEYAPLVEEIFTDYGIPYNRALGRQLSTSPVTLSIILMLNACQEDFSGPSLLRIFNSPFLKFSAQPFLAVTLERFMRQHRIISGREKLIRAIQAHAADMGEPDTLAGSLNDLFDALGPFTTQEPAPLTTWMERLTALVAWSGLDARVEAVHGPLNINLQAHGTLKETISNMAETGKLLSEYRYTFHEWLLLLKKIIMRTRFQVPPEDESGVQILGLQESSGLPWDEIYLGGMIDGMFPQRLTQNIFLPEAILASLGADTLEKERRNAAHHFYRLVLSAKKVTLTWPENKGDRPVVPSPFLEELAPLAMAGLLNRGIDKLSGIQFSLKIEESQSLPELAKAVGIMRNAEKRQGLPPQSDWLAAVSGAMPGALFAITAIKSAIEQKHVGATTAPPPPLKNEFSVTELDEYLACPYDYYVTHILGIKPVEDVTEDISPLERGGKVHSVLRNFYLSWSRPVTHENRSETAALLKKLADSAYDREANTVRNRREKDLFLTVMSERFLDSEELFWKQGMRPTYLEQTIETFKLPLSDGREVTISAKIDRIDVDDSGNFIVVDYKTGKYPQPKTNLEQDIFQLPIYAVMALSALSGKGAPLKQPVGLAYYDLMGKVGDRARDIVLYNKDAIADQPASKPIASKKSAAEFEAILQLTVHKAQKAAESILAGEFPARARDENRCRFCRNIVLCRKKEYDS